MSIKHRIERTRTFRKFKQDIAIDSGTLEELVDLARYAGSARNAQPWQYMLIYDPATCKSIFPYLGWAGYLSDWKGPEDGEQPSAYILCLLNQNWLKGAKTEAHFDLGIASQNILLGAEEKGLGGCRIGAFSPKLATLFNLPSHLSLELVIALGQPAEEVKIVDMPESGSIKYWRDEEQVHHVPKRILNDLIIEPKIA